MGDGDGAAGGDLLLEDGDDAAVGAEDVAEADGDEAGAAVLQRPDQQFGDALGDSHDVGGADGLVGGDHDEVVDAVLGGGGGDVGGAEDIVLDGLEEAGLHHGDVFVGGGVVEDGGP